MLVKKDALCDVKWQILLKVKYQANFSSKLLEMCVRQVRNTYTASRGGFEVSTRLQLKYYRNLCQKMSIANPRSRKGLK